MCRINIVRALHILTKNKLWIGNYIHGFTWDVITYPCPDLNVGLSKPPL